MKKLFYLIAFSGLSLSTAWAQQSYYDWQISAGFGGMAYYGDLSYRLNTAPVNETYRLSIGKRISPSVMLALEGYYGRISGNDRPETWGGELQTGNENFSRALNFRTDIRTANLLFQYRFDNGKIISEHASIAPYLFVGVGVTDFDVYGDLFGAGNQRYYYWSDNSVRNLPENPANANQAQVIEQDGDFETNLTNLQTEQSYPTSVLTIPVGAGVKFKLSDRLSASLQAGAHYTFTEYLDDVSGAYRTDAASEIQAYAINPSGIRRDARGNGKNDAYFSGTLSLTYHFNFKRKQFNAPMVYAGYRQNAVAANQPAKPASPRPTPVTRNKPDSLIGPAPLPKRNPATPLSVAATESSNRQTVDVNVRILIDRGDSIVVSPGATREPALARTQPDSNNARLTFVPDSLTQFDSLQTSRDLQNVYTQADMADITYLTKELEDVRTQLNDLQANENIDRPTIDRDTTFVETDANDSVDTPRLREERTSRPDSPTRNNTRKLVPAKADSLIAQPDTIRQPANISRTQIESENPEKTNRNQTRRTQLEENDEVNRTNTQSRQRAPQDSAAIRGLNRRVEELNNQLDELRAQRDQERETETRQRITQSTQRETEADEPAERTARREQERILEEEQPQPRNRTYRTENTEEEAAIRQQQQENEELRKELQDIRTELQQLRVNNQTNQRNVRQSYEDDLIQQDRENDRERRSTFVAAPIPVPRGNNYNEKEMRDLRRELSTVQTQLQNLQKEQQVDTTVNQRVDSLQNLLNTIERTNAASQPTTNTTPPVATAQPAQQEELMNALRSQITDLNRSLELVRSDLETTEDTPPTPLSALGKTVVYYDVNSAALKPSDKERLTTLATRLNTDRSILLSIRGFTDQTGNPATNLKLSQQRAENVKNYLVNDLGVKINQVLINYFGEQQANSQLRNNPYARRVELELYRGN